VFVYEKNSLGSFTFYDHPGTCTIKKYNIHTVAFYNFENLLTINDPDTFDEEWTPKGLQRWTYDKYQNLLTCSCLSRNWFC
jgi:hypothetical protein